MQQSNKKGREGLLAKRVHNIIQNLKFIFIHHIMALEVSL